MEKIQRRIIRMKVRTIGIDLGKTVFHVVGLDEPGNVVVKKRLSRKQLIRYAANVPIVPPTLSVI